jgi:ribonuclease D
LPAPPVWVGAAGALARAVEALAGAPEVALDTEGDSLHHYPERLALIQVALPDGPVWLIDPLAVPDLAPLGRVFADPATCLVVHAGDNDLAHLKRRHAFVFAAVFDTAIAARLLGLKALGLDALLETLLGVRLPPSRQRDDWSARPLTPAQIEYAAADVLHLFALRRHLVEALGLVDRLAWVEEECAALAAQPVPERTPEVDGWLRVKGARALLPRGLATLRALWEARERLAVAHDRPPFKVFGDEALLRLVEAAPRDREALAAVPGMTPRMVARWGEAILDAIASAHALPPADLPALEPPRRRHVPGPVSRRVERLRRWRVDAASRFGLEPGVFLPNRLIVTIAEAGPRTLEDLAALEGVRRWRVDAFGGELLAALGRA